MHVTRHWRASREKAGTAFLSKQIAIPKTLAYRDPIDPATLRLAALGQNVPFGRSRHANDRWCDTLVENTIDMAVGKLQVLSRITESGLVAIVRTDNSKTASCIVEACAAGGVAAIEITFTVPGAAAVIEELAKRYPAAQITLGAGTVLDPETARIAVLAGAQFVVSPCLNTATARMCNRYQIPYLPGAGTIREIVDAMEAGADIIKIFPGETLGPAFVRAAKAPLPQASLMPAGGVNIDNAAEWIAAGSVALGVGGSLTASARTGDFKSITDLARRFIAVIREARENAGR
jgi:2-dehydro-3-deoxyphosphogluconate aldolase/(4S)-4-hydroxy-2-oxoglutarate aldolase